jgi:hypothetical protein
MKLWLSPEVLAWLPFVETWTSHEGIAWRRPYDHWGHAEGLLRDVKTEFHRTDVIVSLKRSVDGRVRALNEACHFRKAPFPDLPEGRLEQLAFFGIVQPALLGRLLDIRNRVEHQDAEPPTIAACADFIDMVWYFLRSTDFLVRRAMIELRLDRDAGMELNPYKVTINWERRDDWALSVNCDALQSWQIPESTNVCGSSRAICLLGSVCGRG